MSHKIAHRKSVSGRSMSVFIWICAVLFTCVSPAIVRGQSAKPSPDLVTTPVSASNRVVLQGHHPAWANEGADAGVVPADTQLQSLTLVLARTPDREQAFEQFLKDQQNPSSPDFHHWLTPVEIGQRFGASAHDIAAVKSWLESQGLRVDSVSNSMVRMHFSGAAAAVGNAFGAEMHYYTVNNRKLISISEEAQIPAALAPVIQGAGGLYKIENQPMHTAGTAQATITSAQRNGLDSPDATFSCGGSPCYFITPADFATIYNVNPIYIEGTSGAGETIAIIGRSAVDPADISNFQARTGSNFAPPVVIVPPNGVQPPAFKTASGSNPTLDQSEATLDVMRAGSVAPGATIDLIVSGDTQSNDGIAIATEYAVDTIPVPAQIVSISFGACEAQAGSSGVQFWDNLFQQAAGEGISVFVSSGDSGAAGCDAQFQPPPATQMQSPNSICSSSYATCVGGTEFADAANASTYWNPTNNSLFESAISYIPEGAWNEPTNASGAAQVAGTGGGVSTVIPTPSWQTGPGVPVPAVGRYTPDVSFSASSHDGYFGCLESAGASCAGATTFQFEFFAGTSAAAPDMAGIAALLDQSTQQAQGNLNPTLYKIGADTQNRILNDITVATSGVTNCVVGTPSMCNNSTPGQSSPSGGQSGFLVGAGYDEATGLGSINVSNLLSGWTQYTAGSTPSTTSIASNQNPSISGSSVTLTASVSGNGTYPTGNVVFNDGQKSIGTGTLGQLSFNGTTSISTAAISTTSLASGSHSITAVYGGDVNFAVSASSAITQVVNGNNPAPHIASLNPASGVSGQPISEFTATGTNFISGATLSFGGTAVPAAVSSNGQTITANIPGSAVTSIGSIPVIVTNPAPGGGASNTINFSATNPAPTLTSISPSTGPLNSAVAITATGSGFVSGTTLIFNGLAATGTVSNNGTTLVANVPASSITAVGSFQVKVSNPTPGGGLSGAVNFAVDDFSVTGPSQSVTVVAGQTASFALNFATQGGALAAETDFSASNLPPAVSASFIPASIVAGIPSLGTTLTIVTTAHTSSFVHTTKYPDSMKPIGIITFTSLAILTLLILAAKSRQRVANRYKLASAAAFVVLCGAIIAGCGGGSHGPTINTASGTSAGTYPITVTVTSGGATRTTTVTLIVQ
jgi:predicted outer membrane repeat protein